MAAVTALLLSACLPFRDAALVGQPVLVGAESILVNDADVVEWVPIQPENAETEPELWQPAMLHVRLGMRVPDSLADMDEWLRVRLALFSDEPAHPISKDALVLRGGDGRVYEATFVRNITRDQDPVPRLSEVVEMAGGDMLVSTMDYPSGGGSAIIFEAVYAVKKGAEDGAVLVIRGDGLLDTHEVRLGRVPPGVVEGAPETQPTPELTSRAGRSAETGRP
jgi:hypothetical protein